MIACLVARVHSTVRAASPRLTSFMCFFLVSVAQATATQGAQFYMSYVIHIGTCDMDFALVTRGEERRGGHTHTNSQQRLATCARWCCLSLDDPARHG